MIDNHLIGGFFPAPAHLLWNFFAKLSKNL